ALAAGHQTRRPVLSRAGHGMTSRSEHEAEARCLLALEGALDARTIPDLTGYAAEVLDAAFQTLVKRHGGDSGPLLRAIPDRASDKPARRAAKRAIYRLAQSGVAVPSSSEPHVGPVIRRQAERPIRAWLSGIDGTGSRAAWILFEGGLGGQLQLCSLILNDE